MEVELNDEESMPEPEVHKMTLLSEIESTYDIEDPVAFITNLKAMDDFHEIKIDDVTRDYESMQILFDLYRKEMPWADNTLLKIMACRHYDEAYEIAMRIDRGVSTPRDLELVPIKVPSAPPPGDRVLHLE